MFAQFCRSLAAMRMAQYTLFTSLILKQSKRLYWALYKIQKLRFVVYTEPWTLACYFVVTMKFECRWWSQRKCQLGPRFLVDLAMTYSRWRGLAKDTPCPSRVDQLTQPKRLWLQKLHKRAILAIRNSSSILPVSVSSVSLSASSLSLSSSESSCPWPPGMIPSLSSFLSHVGA